MSTTDCIAGQEISETLGEVIGVVTRPRDMKASADQAVVLTETRQAAVAAMIEMAELAEADAVVGLRFDGGKISETSSEVTAYGTAVKLVGGRPRRAEVDESDDAGDDEQDASSQNSDHEGHLLEESNPFLDQGPSDTQDN